MNYRILRSILFAFMLGIGMAELDFALQTTSEKCTLWGFGLIYFIGVPDGLTLNPEAFSKAIKSLSQKDGGIKNITTGVWFIGPITLKSNINLYLEIGSLILIYPIKNCTR